MIADVGSPDSGMTGRVLYAVVLSSLSPFFGDRFDLSGLLYCILKFALGYRDLAAGLLTIA